MASAGSIQQQKHATNTGSSHPAVKDGEKSPSSQSSLFRFLVVVTVGLLGCAAYVVAFGKYYTPRSGLGFYLGVTGTLMMLTLLVYPLRKHVRWMQRWGALKHWFRAHMILGIVGPTLVLFHSTFHIRSPNAAVALSSMLVVVISGFIGRFVYTKIHYGLYGSRATLEKVHEEFAGRSQDTKTRLHFAPRVEQWLQAFEQISTRADRSFTANLLQLLILRVKRRLLQFRCAWELRGILRAERHPEFREGAPEAIHLVSLYLKEVERVAHFSTYERLFSLWHVLHIPLIYILAASTVFHIIAVYMY